MEFFILWYCIIFDDNFMYSKVIIEVKWFVFDIFLGSLLKYKFIVVIYIVNINLN